MMEQTKIQRYPIGIQTFPEVIKLGYVYIDKTEYIWKLAHGTGKYFFLSRPRRFGKSLLVSTLQSYFEGRRELFRGLAIERLETEWTAYPVLHFDMSIGKHLKQQALLNCIVSQLQQYEKVYGVVPEFEDTNIRLINLVKAASEQTGQQVVLLIDEYDSPLLDVVHMTDEMEEMRYTMRNFFSPLKSLDPYLRFVFLTGVTKFSQMSIFSELNNLNNISMDKAYAAICGITESEMRAQLMPGIECMAAENECTVEQMQEKLKGMYDGYHFAWPSEDIYNPYSLLNALDKREADDYWFDSGTPTFIVELMKRSDMSVTEFARKSYAYDFIASPEQTKRPAPLLYQSGYLTIKGYEKASGRYLLDIPNEEVRIGLFRGLLPMFVKSEEKANNVIGDMKMMMADGDMDGALRRLQTYLSTVPYTDNASSEGHYQQVLYVIFTLMGFDADVEVHTPRGRVDLVVKTPSRLYLIEVKMDRSADAAMEQIDLKDYAERFSLSKLPVVKVGVNFDSEKRTLGDWVIG